MAKQGYPGHRDRAAGQLERKQPRSPRQMLVEHDRAKDDRSDGFNGIDDGQAERKRSGVEGALPEQATEDAGSRQGVR